MQRKPSCAINTFHCQQKMNGAQRRTLVCIQVPEECLARTAVCQKHLLGWSDVKQWKIQAHSISHYQSNYAWLRASGSQSEKNSVKYFLKILWQLFESIADRSESLFLGLVLPNQYHPSVISENWDWFLGDLLYGPRLLLGRPYFEPLLWFMMTKLLLVLRWYKLLHFNVSFLTTCWLWHSTNTNEPVQVEHI